MKPRCSKCPIKVAESSRFLNVPEPPRRWDGPLDKVGFPSLPVNSLDNVVEACCKVKSVSTGGLVEGSSTSFSGRGNVRRRKGRGPDVIGGGSLPLAVFRRLILPLEADRAASGLELLEGVAELKDACAVFADTEAVGGPEEKIDIGGGSKKVD